MSQPESSPATGPRLPRPIAAVFTRLPQFPHSVALSVALNQVLRPLISEVSANALRDRVFAIRVDDAGIEFRLRYGPTGFAPATRTLPPEVTFSATTWDYSLMARRLEDPDTLFFQRRLRIEGDTELGLIVKNTLDAVDWNALPTPMRLLIDRASALLGVVVRVGPSR